MILLALIIVIPKTAKAEGYTYLPASAGRTEVGYIMPGQTAKTSFVTIPNSSDISMNLRSPTEAGSYSPGVIQRHYRQYNVLALTQNHNTTSNSLNSGGIYRDWVGSIYYVTFENITNYPIRLDIDSTKVNQLAYEGLSPTPVVIPPTPITVIRPTNNLTQKPTEIEFTINSTWPENTGLHLVQTHINGSSYNIHNMTELKVRLQKNSFPIIVQLADMKAGQTTFQFRKTNLDGSIPPDSLVYSYVVDYDPTQAGTETGITVTPRVKFWRDVDSNSDTTKIYMLTTGYNAQYNWTGKIVPGTLKVQTHSIYNSAAEIVETEYKYPPTSFLTNFYQFFTGESDAKEFTFTKRVLADTDSQHNLLNPVYIRLRFWPDGHTGYVEHFITIPTGYNPWTEGRDWFLQKVVDTDNEIPNQDGDYSFDDTNQDRAGFDAPVHFSQYADEVTNKILEKMQLGPLQQTFAKLSEMNTDQGTAPVFKLNLNAFATAGSAIHGQTGEVLGAEANEITFVDLSVMEQHEYAGFTLIGLIRLLIGFGCLYMTVMYVWRKIEEVSGA